MLSKMASLKFLKNQFGEDGLRERSQFSLQSFRSLKKGAKKFNLRPHAPLKISICCSGHSLALVKKEEKKRRRIVLPMQKSDFSLCSRRRAVIVLNNVFDHADSNYTLFISIQRNFQGVSGSFLKSP